MLRARMNDDRLTRRIAGTRDERLHNWPPSFTKLQAIPLKLNFLANTDCCLRLQLINDALTCPLENDGKFQIWQIGYFSNGNKCVFAKQLHIFVSVLAAYRKIVAVQRNGFWVSYASGLIACLRLKAASKLII